MYSSRKYSYLPHGAVSSKTPTPLKIPIKFHTFLLILWSNRPRTPTPRKFQTLPWEGGYGHFLDLRNAHYVTFSTEKNNKMSQAIKMMCQQIQPYELFVSGNAKKTKRNTRTSTSSWDVRVECEPMINKVGVFSSRRGSSTPCKNTNTNR